MKVKAKNITILEKKEIDIKKKNNLQKWMQHIQYKVLHPYI